MLKRFVGVNLGRFWLWILCLAVLFVAAKQVQATMVVLKDGRLLRGRLGEVSGLADIPQPPDPEGAGPLPLILLVDNDLCRTFVSKRLVQEVRQDDFSPSEEKFLIRQRALINGQIIRSVGPAMRVQPFDEFGRRIFTMYTVRGPVDVIQGITELTPRWAKVEGITHVWDMRIATNSIPRDVLQKILLKQINPQDIEQRKKIARFYLQSERYEDAERVLEDLLQSFPDRKDLKEQLTPSLRAIKQLSAQQLLGELKLRRDAGQHDLVLAALRKFPSDQVGGEILQGAGDMLQDYETMVARRAKVMEKIDELLPKITDPYRRQMAAKVRDEIAAELSFNTMDRMAAFLQNADDADISAEEKLALAISGWLLGGDAAIEQLPVALSMYNIRGQLREYLNEPIKIKREQIIDSLGSESGASPGLVAGLLSHMKPPGDVPQPISSEMPGYFKLEAPGLPKQPPITYWVQLPPEYDPYKLYPAIVTLHGAGNTAQSQVDWWAGEWSKKSSRTAEKSETDARPSPADAKTPVENAPPAVFTRQGQATRHGYIIIAPEWTAEHQKQYGYSAREHAAALNSLRDACRRFSIDTDRVFLSGYSMGGDAAWDIGLAHPDLWAGVIPISALSDRYCTFYWENANYVPFYVILGELDGSRLTQNARDLDRYFKHGYNATVIEYEGRGHDDFHEEILRIFDWMGHFRRNFFPREFTCATMREGDSFFWWMEIEGLPPRSAIDPADWPPPAGTRPVEVSGTITNNNIYIRTGTVRVSVFLAPQMVDFKRQVKIVVNGRRINTQDPFLRPELRTILEDVRTRADRQHPFWIRLDSPTGRVLGK
jgi:predicted esterase